MLVNLLLLQLCVNFALYLCQKSNSQLKNQMDPANIIDIKCTSYLSDARDKNSQITDCSSQQLTSVPMANKKRSKNGAAGTLLLDRNKIRELKTFDFKSWSNLSHLHVAYNLISIIHVDAFDGLSKLQVLSLQGNQITLPPGMPMSDRNFMHLKSIRELDLSKNPLIQIPRRFFQNLLNIKILNLSSTSNLSSNAALKLIPESFHNLINLQTLDLSNNSFVTLHDKMRTDFESMKSLNQLWIGGETNKWQCDCQLRWLKIWQLNTFDNIWPQLPSSNKKINIPVAPNIRDNQRLFRSINDAICNDNTNRLKPKQLFSEVMVADFACKPLLNKTIPSAEESLVTNGYNSNQVLVTLGYKSKQVVTLECAFYSDPRSEVNWHKNGTLINTSKQRDNALYAIVTQQGLDFSTILTIKNFTFQEAGAYTCNSSNTRGYASATFLVTIVIDKITPAIEASTTESETFFTVFLRISVLIGFIISSLIASMIWIASVFYLVHVYRLKEKRANQGTQEGQMAETKVDKLIKILAPPGSETAEILAQPSGIQDIHDLGVDINDDIKLKAIEEAYLQANFNVLKPILCAASSELQEDQLTDETSCVKIIENMHRMEHDSSFNSEYNKPIVIPHNNQFEGTTYFPPCPLHGDLYVALQNANTYQHASSPGSNLLQFYNNPSTNSSNYNAIITSETNHITSSCSMPHTVEISSRSCTNCPHHSNYSFAHNYCDINDMNNNYTVNTSKPTVLQNVSFDNIENYHTICPVHQRLSASTINSTRGKKISHKTINSILSPSTSYTESRRHDNIFSNLFHTLGGSSNNKHKSSHSTTNHSTSIKLKKSVTIETPMKELGFSNVHFVTSADSCITNDNLNHVNNVNINHKTALLSRSHNDGSISPPKSNNIIMNHDNEMCQQTDKSLNKTASPQTSRRYTTVV